jgi:ribonuclease HI
MEYRGVYTKTKQELFRSQTFENATNNIGEFLAIVHALGYLKKQNSSAPVYSDSLTAMSWVHHKKANTKLNITSANQSLFYMIERAEKWLKENKYPNKLLKWETKAWGENPADFGRK